MTHHDEMHRKVSTIAQSFVEQSNGDLKEALWRLSCVVFLQGQYIESTNQTPDLFESMNEVIMDLHATNPDQSSHA